MPELPEVEEVRRSLDPVVVGRHVKQVRVYREDFVTAKTGAVRALEGKRFTRTRRHGKKLFLVTGDGGKSPGGPTLVVHLGMTGRVDCVAPGSPMLRHTHVVMTLDSGVEVRFCDPRRFGGMWYYPSEKAATDTETAGLGPDALEVTPAHLQHWRQTRGRLKQRLLSQRDVAGLGNIYVDEALWMAHLHPLQRVSRLKHEHIEKLVAAILEVLNRSLAMGGTTLRDYRNARNEPGRFIRMLQAYGRAGEACRRCGTILKSAVVATRTTVFCPSCQRQR